MRFAGQPRGDHPSEIVEGIIIYFMDNGFKNIKIIESSWVGDSTKNAFKVCGYETLSKKYGVPLIDLKDDAYVKRLISQRISIYAKRFSISTIW